MTVPIVIRVLGPLALALSSMALQAAPGDKTMRVYSTRMETLFIRLDINGDGRLDASEVQGRRALSRVLKRQNKSFLSPLEGPASSGFIAQWPTPEAPFPPGRPRPEPSLESSGSQAHSLDQSQLQRFGW